MQSVKLHVSLNPLYEIMNRKRVRVKEESYNDVNLKLQ